MKKYSGLALLLITLLIACAKENEFYSTAALSDYLPLKVGKQITYNLDSTVYINFGLKDTVIKYQVKDSIEAQITDNLGRPSFRIVRYIRKNANQAWAPMNSFMATPTATTVEFVENNLRFVKLVLPIKEEHTWKGNQYFAPDPYPAYGFSGLYMDDWDYTYQFVNAPLTVGTFNFPNSLTVLQRDDSLNNLFYTDRTYAVEKYAKNIGLAYKEFLHWEYQGLVGFINCKRTTCVNNTCTTSSVDCTDAQKCDSIMRIPGNKIVCDTVTTNFHYIGFGVKLTMIDHN